MSRKPIQKTFRGVAQPEVEPLTFRELANRIAAPLMTAHSLVADGRLRVAAEIGGRLAFLTDDLDTLRESRLTRMILRR